MLHQLKYSFRNRLDLRLISLVAVILMNIAFGICGSLNLYGAGGKITAVSLVSVALFALLVICILADADAIRSLFSAPSGYSVLLAPVPSWKVLLGRLIPMAVMDIISIGIGTVGVLWQSFLLAGLEADMIGEVSNLPVSTALWFLLIALINYLILLLIIFFVYALRQSVFFRFPAKRLLVVLSVAVILYVLSLVDIVLAPMGSVCMLI